MTEPMAVDLDGVVDGNQDRFRALFGAIDEGYCLCEMIVDDEGRPVDYRFLEVNPLFEEMTGLHDAVGRTALELVPDLERHWVETYARAGLGGERIRFQQGSAPMGRWFDVFTMPVDRHGRFAIVFREETARHRAELALQESEERYRVLAEQERQNSLRLQHALLPATVEDHPDLDIEARYRAAAETNEVGGAWYDTASWPDGRVGIMVGDVIGHNLDAAAAMGHLRAGVAALSGRIPSSPAAWLDALDECARGPNGSEFVTAACVVLDPSTDDLRYSSAGHPPMLVICPDGDVHWLDAVQSPPIGSVVVDERAEAVAPIEPGSLVVLYSDGLVERRGEGIDVGLDRLGTVAAGLVGVEPGTACEVLMGELGQGIEQSDDIVVVAAKYGRRDE